MTIPSHAELLREYLEQLSLPGAESRLPVWTDWVRLRSLGSAMAIGAALTLAACDSDTDPTNGSGNIAGGAGVGQGAAAGWLNTTSVYSAPLTGGTNATSTDVGGASSTGGMSAGTRYAVPLGGSGGQSVGQGGAGAATAVGGSSIATLYGAPMEKQSLPAIGPDGG